VKAKVKVKVKAEVEVEIEAETCCEPDLDFSPLRKTTPRFDNFAPKF
jgi:hypothetical protein